MGRDKDITFQSVFEDTLYLILPSFHPWQGKKRLKPEDLLTERLLVQNQQTITHAIIADKLSNEGWVTGGMLEVGSAEAIKEMLKTGQGHTFQISDLK